MALINCPECGKENISDNAETCPNCGYPISKRFESPKKEQKKKNIVVIIIAVIVILAIALIGTLIANAHHKQDEIDIEILGIYDRLSDNNTKNDSEAYAKYIKMVDDDKTVGIFSTEQAKDADAKIQSKLDEEVQLELYNMSKEKNDPFKNYHFYPEDDVRMEGGLDNREINYETFEGTYYVDNNTCYNISNPNQIVYKSGNAQVDWDIYAIEMCRDLAYLHVKDHQDSNSENVFVLSNRSGSGAILMEGSGSSDVKSNHVNKVGIKFE